MILYELGTRNVGGNKLVDVYRRDKADGNEDIVQKEENKIIGTSTRSA